MRRFWKWQNKYPRDQNANNNNLYDSNAQNQIIQKRNSPQTPSKQHLENAQYSRLDRRYVNIRLDKKHQRRKKTPIHPKRWQARQEEEEKQQQQTMYKIKSNPWQETRNTTMYTIPYPMYPYWRIPALCSHTKPHQQITVSAGAVSAVRRFHASERSGCSICDSM